MDEEVSIVAVFLIERWALVFNTVGMEVSQVVSELPRYGVLDQHLDPYHLNTTDSVDQLPA